MPLTFLISISTPFHYLLYAYIHTHTHTYIYIYTITGLYVYNLDTFLLAAFNPLATHWFVP